MSFNRRVMSEGHHSSKLFFVRKLRVMRIQVCEISLQIVSANEFLTGVQKQRGCPLMEFVAGRKRHTGKWV